MRRPLTLRLEERAREVGSSALPEPVKPVLLRAYRRLRADPDDEPGIEDQIRRANARQVLESPLVGDCFSDVPGIGLAYLNNLQRFVFGIETVGYDRP
jgi:hypothetical protein